MRLIFHTLLLHSGLVFVKYITTALTCVVLMVFEVVFKLFFRPHEDQIVFYYLLNLKTLQLYFLVTINVYLRTSKSS